MPSYVFSLFRELVLGFGFCLMIPWLICFLCFTSSVRLSGFYTEDERFRNKLNN